MIFVIVLASNSSETIQEIYCPSRVENGIMQFQLTFKKDNLSPFGHDKRHHWCSVSVWSLPMSSEWNETIRVACSACRLLLRQTAWMGLLHWCNRLRDDSNRKQEFQEYQDACPMYNADREQPEGEWIDDVPILSSKSFWILPGAQVSSKNFFLLRAFLVILRSWHFEFFFVIDTVNQLCVYLVFCIWNCTYMIVSKISIKLNSNLLKGRLVPTCFQMWYISIQMWYISIHNWLPFDDTLGSYGCWPQVLYYRIQYCLFPVHISVLTICRVYWIRCCRPPALISLPSPKERISLKAVRISANTLACLCHV